MTEFDPSTSPDDEASPLPVDRGPDSARVFESELDTDASQHRRAVPASPEARAEAASLNALVVADEVVAGYFPGINILNGCSLYAQRGELVGIIGPNGAGKSTLLKALFGLVKVNSGSVTLGTSDITNLRADRLVRMGIGFVPQTNNVFPSLTIEEEDITRLLECLDAILETVE